MLVWHASSVAAAEQERLLERITAAAAAVVAHDPPPPVLALVGRGWTTAVSYERGGGMHTVVTFFVCLVCFFACLLAPVVFCSFEILHVYRLFCSHASRTLSDSLLTAVGCRHVKVLRLLISTVTPSVDRVTGL